MNLVIKIEEDKEIQQAIKEVIIGQIKTIARDNFKTLSEDVISTSTSEFLRKLNNSNEISGLITRLVQCYYKDSIIRIIREETKKLIEEKFNSTIEEKVKEEVKKSLGKLFNS
mgnify:CR=1 FL=1